MRRVNLENHKGKIRYLYYDKGFSLKGVAEEIGVSAGLIRKKMLLWGMNIRRSRKRNLMKPSKEELKESYINKNSPVDKTAKNFDVSVSTIFRWLKEYKILPARRFKYKKYNFSGNPSEKAYLMGLVTGDLHTREHGKQILVELSTTHPAMIDLFYTIFQKYGTPKKYIKYNRITKRYGWKAYVHLNNSFNFVLSKDDNIDDEYFYDFLAGFFDSEGCLHVYDNHNYIGLTVLIYNSNKRLLEIIKRRLEKDGFHPKFSIFFKSGRKTREGYYSKKELWAVRLHTNKEVLSLMSLIPIKHREKLEKLKIISSVNNNKWEEISNQINNLRMSIRREVEEYVKP